MIRALLIDLDATLVDSEPVWRVAYERTADELARRLPVDWWAQVAGHSLDASIEVLAPGADAATRTRLVGTLVRHATATITTHGITALPGAQAVVAAAEEHQVPVGVVTSAAAAFARAALEAVDVHPRVLVTADDPLPAKPDPAPYLDACRRLRVDPADALVVEDSPSGVAAGIAAGARVLAVPSGRDIAPDPRVQIVARLDLLDPVALLHDGTVEVAGAEAWRDGPHDHDQVVVLADERDEPSVVRLADLTRGSRR